MKNQSANDGRGRAGAGGAYEQIMDSISFVFEIEEIEEEFHLLAMPLPLPKRRVTVHNEESDALLFGLVKRHGKKWSFLSKRCGRSPDVIRNRYVRLIGRDTAPRGAYKYRAAYVAKKDDAERRSEWTKAEDCALIGAILNRRDAHKRIQWAALRRLVGPKRTIHAVRNRATRLGAGLRPAQHTDLTWAEPTSLGVSPSPC